MEVDLQPSTSAAGATTPPEVDESAPNHLSTSSTQPTLQQITDAFQPKYETPAAWVEHAASSTGGADGFWNDVKTCYQKSLWHNLTVLLDRYVDSLQGNDGRHSDNVDQVELFSCFIRPLHPKMNPLKYVEFARKIAKTSLSPDQNLGFLLFAFVPLRDPRVHPQILNTVTGKKNALPEATPLETQAFALSLSSLAFAHLLNGEQDKAKSRLDECDKLVKALDIVEPVVMGGYYSVSADYHKVKADYVAFYRSSLLFLACINIDTDLTSADKVMRAHDLAIAALLGESIYNFGELLQHPILSALDNTQYEWLKQMLFVFNAGDIGKYEVLSQRLAEEPILASDSDFLRQKICLMALIEAVFRRPRDERSMSFQTIAQETKLPIHEVEHLVMKALSLNLIKGNLDQVNNVANILWVQPRVLDKQQMEALAKQLDSWCNKVGNVGDLVGTYKQPFTAAA